MKLKKLLAIILVTLILSASLGGTALAGIDPHSWYLKANTIQE